VSAIIGERSLGMAEHTFGDIGLPGWWSIDHSVETRFGENSSFKIQ
jgi:hypothetical protein